MKKAYFLLFWVWFCVFQMSFGQEKEQTIKELCYQLTGSEAFQECKDFRDKFEQMNLALAQKPKLKFSEYEQLRLAYNNMQKKYMDFVGVVRGDITDYRNVQRLMKDSTTASQQYASRFDAVKNAYENEYLPVYYKIKGSYGKIIPPELISLGVDVFAKLIGVIKERKSLKEEALNTILGTVNQNFYNKLAMKRWYELVPPYDEVRRVKVANPIPQKSGGEQGTSTTSTTPQGEDEDEDMQHPNPNDEDANEDPVAVSPPIFAEMAGFVSFVYLDENTQPQNMDFAKNGAKDIDVQGLNGSEKISTCHYMSKEEYKNGTQFYVKVNNSAGMYIFALNSGNKIHFLYPYKNDKIGNCQGARTRQKDIDVQTLNTTPVVGQDADGNTILPIPDCSSQPPKPRYFTINGNAKAETFCIILTKSEIDTQQLTEELEEEEGDLNERLLKVFGNQIISPEEGKLEMVNNKLNFDASEVEKEILPVVFVIKRK